MELAKSAWIHAMANECGLLTRGAAAAPVSAAQTEETRTLRTCFYPQKLETRNENGPACSLDIRYTMHSCILRYLAHIATSPRPAWFDLDMKEACRTEPVQNQGPYPGNETP